MFYHADIKGAFLTGKRMEVLRAIVEKKGREAITVVTTMDAFLDGLPSKEELYGNRELRFMQKRRWIFRNYRKTFRY